VILIALIAEVKNILKEGAFFTMVARQQKTARWRQTWKPIVVPAMKGHEKV